MEGVADDAVGGPAVEAGDESHAAGVVLIGGVVQARAPRSGVVGRLGNRLRCCLGFVVHANHPDLMGSLAVARPDRVGPVGRAAAPCRAGDCQYWMTLLFHEVILLNFTRRSCR